ncbi:MAG TPA: N-6 DNA methylase [Actinomycetota bacterium]|nr:N-6 DNA methylase [Actinomycetota bacterium]
MTPFDGGGTGSAPAAASPVPARRASSRERDPRRRLGAFYTPQIAAQVMTDWVLRSPSDRILEPSFGDGSFLQVVAETAAARGWSDVDVVGVEVDERPHAEAIARGLIAPGAALRGDFLEVDPFPVDAVLGNPPFVRLRHLPPRQRARALGLARDVLGVRMQSSGSLWMPFVLHATRFLRPGGRLALVLPFELTYVRYARPLWEYLGATFGRLSVLRARDRLFPDILQEAVVLLADGKGRTTSAVELRAFETVADLGEDDPAATASLSLQRVVAGERAFLEGLLPPPLQDLLRDKLHDLTRPADAFVDFRIGYVAADKSFFHPDAAAIAAYGLDGASLVPAVTSTRKLNGAGLHTSGLTRDRHELLFLPRSPRDLTPAEAAYVVTGEQRGVHRRYKCRVREPWFLVPQVEFPDLILSVFCELPLLMLNDGGFAASNSLLCAYVRDGYDRRAFAASWYTSLTALQCELQVHSLGGGVLVLVPREARAVRMVPPVAAPPGHLRLLDSLLRDRRFEDAYRAGDDAVLRKAYRLTGGEIALIEEGAATLHHWRSGRPV